MGYNATFNISVILWRCFIAGESGVPWKNNRPSENHWQTHNVLSSTPRHEQDSNSQRKVI